MAVVLNQMLVIFSLGKSTSIACLSALLAIAQKLRQTIDTSVLQNYSGPRWVVNMSRRGQMWTPIQ